MKKVGGGRGREVEVEKSERLSRGRSKYKAMDVTLHAGQKSCGIATRFSKDLFRLHVFALVSQNPI